MESLIRFYPEIDNESFVSDNVETPTSIEQTDVERTIKAFYRQFERESSIDPDLPKLEKKSHIKMLKSSLKSLSSSYACLDASQPWLLYWILHSLYLLNAMPDSETLSSCIKFLNKCQHKDGGYGGGYLQYPHLGTTYAAVSALTIIGTREAYRSIERTSLHKFLWSVRKADGSFALHKGGEDDIRGAYCAICIARITETYSDALFDQTAEWVASCQTYEGGYGGRPEMEAHGGYSFCGIATLALLNKTDLCDVSALLRWCANKQMRLEGGFQGRTNKLVDGCYSFWHGCGFPIISCTLYKQEHNELTERVLFDQGALQEYILICCQSNKGGFIDKPGKPVDIYHTCYNLSGLSVAQHGTEEDDKVVIGCPDNELNTVHPLYNISAHLVYNAIYYFRSRPPVKK